MRTFAEIAQEISDKWNGVNAYARPYLSAMSCMYTTDKRAEYGCEEIRWIVCYFLENAKTWRGDDARRIKAELRSMIA